MKSVKSELPFMSYIKTVNKTCRHPHRSCFPKTQVDDVYSGQRCHQAFAREAKFIYGPTYKVLSCPQTDVVATVVWPQPRGWRWSPSCCLPINGVGWTQTYTAGSHGGFQQHHQRLSLSTIATGSPMRSRGSPGRIGFSLVACVRHSHMSGRCMICLLSRISSRCMEPLHPASGHQKEWPES